MTVLSLVPSGRAPRAALDLVAFLEKYVILPKGAAEALALYVFYTHAFDVFDVSPYLVISSPVKRCGKTRLQDLLAVVVHEPLRASSATPASLFRRIDQGPVTLLLDETDAWFGNEDLRALVNAGFTRGSAYVLRSVPVGNTWIMKQFSVWCPKVFAGIGRLPSTVEDRSIIVPMRRKEAGEQVARLRLAALEEEARPIREAVATAAAAVADRLQTVSPAPIADFSDRQNDVWEPLLAIAELIGGEWPERTRAAARNLVQAAVTHDEQDLQIALLGDLRELLQGWQEDDAKTEDLLGRLLAMTDRPWGESENGKPLNAHRLARRLRAFGIGPRKIRSGTGTYRGYLIHDLEDAWRRYL